jgi:hypothetical protein
MEMISCSGVVVTVWLTDVSETLGCLAINRVEMKTDSVASGSVLDSIDARFILCE